MRDRRGVSDTVLVVYLDTARVSADTGPVEIWKKFDIWFCKIYYVWYDMLHKILA